MSVPFLFIDLLSGSTLTAFEFSIVASFVVISPYLTKPPPIATTAAISAAIPAN